MTILDQLAAHARERVAADQAENSLDVLQAQCPRHRAGEGGALSGRPDKAGAVLYLRGKEGLPLQGGHRERIPLSGDCEGL